MSERQMQAGYFGKLPSCSDFVRSASHHVLAELLDQWLAEVMRRLAANPRWRQHYDDFPALRFAFVGTRARQAVLGHLVASRDLSQRRFPFVSMSQAAQRGFAASCPLAFEPAWLALSAAATGSLPPVAVRSAADADALLQAWLRRECLAGLQQALGGLPLRRLLPAVGLLLRAVGGQPAPPARCLALPLPPDPACQPLVAALWTTLAQASLARRDLELGLYLTRMAGAHWLVIGFDGADPAALHAIIDPEAGRAGLLDCSRLDWVEGALGGDPALLRLDACLEQEQIGLDTVLQLYLETFCGS